MLAGGTVTAVMRRRTTRRLRTRLALAATTAAAAALLVAPAGADAAVSCDFGSGVLDVSLGASGDALAMSLDKGAIRLSSPPSGTALVCTGGAPTASNTNAISVHNSPGMTENVVGIFNANEFAPGLSDEPGDDEIEIFVNLNDGARTALFVSIAVSPGNVVLGTNGINPNASDGEVQPDRDIDHNDSMAEVTVGGGPGPDLISARGGRGTGGPLTRRITVFGDEGDDTLFGGDGPDLLDGSDGDDVVAGFGGADLLGGGEGANGTLSGGDGNDFIVPGSATDPVDGGAGDDVLSYDELASGVSVSLEGTAAEQLRGTQFDDVLAGDDGPNQIDGLDGDDQIDGRGGADRLGGGVGDDTLQIRDGEADTADCGPGPQDTVTADRLGVDLLTGCETAIFPSLPDPGGGAAAPPAFGARTLVTITLANRRIPATGPLAVRVSNADAFDISGTMSGQTTRRLSQRKRRPRLAARSFTVPANARKTVKLTLPKPLRRQLARRRTLSLRITVKVRDPAGTTRTVSKTLRPRVRARFERSTSQ